MYYLNFIRCKKCFFKRDQYMFNSNCMTLVLPRLLHLDFGWTLITLIYANEIFEQWPTYVDLMDNH